MKSPKDSHKVSLQSIDEKTNEIKQDRKIFRAIRKVNSEIKNELKPKKEEYFINEE